MSAGQTSASAAAQALFALPAAFERGVAAAADLPEPNLPEIAFAGRSNVGKSSLLNALLARKNLARASAAPGRTREINFFRLGERLRLVDLPGYGYAKAPKAQIAQWNALVHDYLRGRQGLKRLFLLIDGRHGLKANDGEVLDALDLAAVSYQGVLTKTDKITPGALDACRAGVEAALAKRPAAHPVLLAASAQTGAGIACLREEISALIGS